MSGPLVDPLADHHTHTRMSDGAGTLADNLRAALDRGLHTMVVTDHVRADTTWVPAYAAALARVRRRVGLRLVVGVESTLMDTSGQLDLPRETDGVEYLAVADHRWPTPDGPVHPGAAAQALADGRLDRRRLLDDLVLATARAAARYGPVTLAHLFSVLPRSGLSEDELGDDHLAAIAVACRDSGSAVEVNERRRCPSARVVGAFAAVGVPLVASSDAHDPAAVGRYTYLAEVLGVLGGAAVA